MHVSSVSPPCLFSLIAFEIRCIGRVLLVLGSRLKNEVYIRIHICFPAFIFGVYFHCMLHVCCDENASGHHHYNKMQFSDGEHNMSIIFSIRRIEQIETLLARS